MADFNVAIELLFILLILIVAVLVFYLLHTITKVNLLRHCNAMYACHPQRLIANAVRTISAQGRSSSTTSSPPEHILTNTISSISETIPSPGRSSITTGNIPGTIPEPVAAAEDNPPSYEDVVHGDYLPDYDSAVVMSLSPAMIKVECSAKTVRLDP